MMRLASINACMHACVHMIYTCAFILIYNVYTYMYTYVYIYIWMNVLYTNDIYILCAYTSRSLVLSLAPSLSFSPARILARSLLSPE